MEETVFDINFVGSLFSCFYVKNTATAETIIAKLAEKSTVFSLDTETTPILKYKGYAQAALSPHTGKIRLLQIFDGDNSFVFDLNNIPLGLFKPFLECKRFVAHNALFDLGYLKHYGVPNCNMGCTMLAWIILYQALYPDDEGFSAKLQDVVHTLLKSDILKHMQTSDWGSEDLTYEQILYAGVDAICVKLIADKLSKGLEKHGLLNYYQLCKKAIQPISSIQLNGMKLDTEHHKKAVDTWRLELIEAKKKVEALTGLSSITAHTIAEWLEKSLDPETLAIWPRTEHGKLKTDTHAFSDFSHLSIVEPFTAYQKKQTLCSTFGTNLFGFINPATKRIHSSYFICGARTGRLSSRNPNGQNMPARDKTVRESFVAEPGNVLIVADYGQVELRCAAEISQDETMLSAYRDGIDLHRLTASKVSRKPLNEVTDEERQMAKAINFGLLFGLGAKKFSHYAKKSYGVEVSEKDAFEAVEVFRETYPGYRKWQLEQAEKAEKTKTCVTPTGKKRRLPDDNTFGNSMNHPVQGGAAEVMLSALIHVEDLFSETPVKLITTVHDEIVLECPLNWKEQAGKILKDCMYAGYLDVFPNGITRDLVEVGAGKNWAEAKSKENRLHV